jgi:tRNA modification GTPase
VFDTIVAPATPLVASALAIVRIDGPDAPKIAGELTGRALEPRVATHTRVAIRGELLDDAVVTFFAAPRSFTGNDAVEITTHGSPYIVRRLVEVIVELGARVAEPGEFTERAVLNGKLDLLQAEAVLQLIESRTELQAKLSLSQLEGELSRLAQQIRGSLLFVISRLEAALDFAEEGYEFVTRPEAEGRIGEVREALRRMLGTYERGHSIMSGLSLVLLGRPNAGKSTLMNWLCGAERAIVTEIPGTTRDLLRETIDIAGVPVTLTDTAGLRSSSDRVEEIGIGRAREAARGAEIVLYLVDAEAGLVDADRSELDALDRPLLTYTKIDRAKAPAGALAVSVPTGVGLDDLLSRLESLVRERIGTDPSALLVNDRQRGAVVSALESLDSAHESLSNMASEDLVLVDLYRAADSLAALTGAITLDDVMTEIFTKFCIGK